MMRKKPPESTCNPVSVTTSDISAAAAKLGIVRGFDPLPLVNARIYSESLAKTGQTTLFSSVPGALLIDMEDAARSVLNPVAARVTVLNKQSLAEVMGFLAEGAMRDKREFTTVVFDPIDKLQIIAMDELSGEVSMDILRYGGGQGGWSLISKRVLSYLRRTYEMGYGWVATCHQKWASTIGSEGQQIQYLRPCVTPGISEGIRQDADYLVKMERICEHKQVRDPKDHKRRITQKEITVIMTTEDSDGRGYDAELGTRVPLSPSLRIPRIGGWDVLAADWVASVSRLRIAGQA